MTDSNELGRLLALAADALDASNVRGILIGGCARNVYAPPRGTKDVDLAVDCDEAGYRGLCSALADRMFTPTSTVSSDLGDPVPDITIFQNPDVGRIDVLVSKTEFESTAIARGVRVGRLKVAAVEDLIAYKLIAGRTRDFHDIEDIVRTQARDGRAIAWDAIAASVAPWDIEDRIARARRSRGD